MLPFMNKIRRQDSGMSVIERKPDEGKEESPDAGIEAAASDLINAVHSKDTKAVVMAIRAIFELVEQEPHIEAGEPSESEQE